MPSDWDGGTVTAANAPDGGAVVAIAFRQAEAPGSTD